MTFCILKHLTSILKEVFTAVFISVEEMMLLSPLLLSAPGSPYLWADVEVAVDGQNWVVSVLNSLRKESVAAALQEPFKQELGRGVQEGLFAVWGTNILGRADWGGVFYFLERGEIKFSVPWCFMTRRQSLERPFTNGRTLNEHDTHHEFRFDQEVLVSPDWNVFLHETEVVEAAQQQPTAVHPQIEVHLLTAIPAHRTKTHTQKNNNIRTLHK